MTMTSSCQKQLNGGSISRRRGLSNSMTTREAGAGRDSWPEEDTVENDWCSCFDLDYDCMLDE